MSPIQTLANGRPFRAALSVPGVAVTFGLVLFALGLVLLLALRRNDGAFLLGPLSAANLTAIVTEAPSRARPTAVSTPIPEVAPVITTFRPVMSALMGRTTGFSHSGARPRPPPRWPGIGGGGPGDTDPASSTSSTATVAR